MDPNVQFVIIVGTVIGGFLWLRQGIKTTHAKLDALHENLSHSLENLSFLLEDLHEITVAMHDTLGSIRGYIGFTEQPPANFD